MKKVMLCIFSLIFILFAACTGVSFLVEDWMTPEVAVASARNRSEETGIYPESLPAAPASAPPAGTTVQFVCCLLVLLPPLFLFTRYNTEPAGGVPLAQSRNPSDKTGIHPEAFPAAPASTPPAGTAAQSVCFLPILLLFFFTGYNTELVEGIALAEIKG